MSYYAMPWDPLHALAAHHGGSMDCLLARHRVASGGSSGVMAVGAGKLRRTTLHYRYISTVYSYCVAYSTYPPIRAINEWPGEAPFPGAAIGQSPSRFRPSVAATQPPF